MRASQRLQLLEEPAERAAPQAKPRRSRAAQRLAERARGIAPAGDGSAYASGVFADEADLAGRAASGGANGDDYLMRLSWAGAPEWLVLQSGAGPSTGAEIRSDERGVIASSVLSGAVELTRDGSQLASLTPPGGWADTDGSVSVDPAQSQTPWTFNGQGAARFDVTGNGHIHLDFA